MSEALKTFRIHPDDNVAVVLESLPQGIPAGHKVALRAIAPGEAVVKYGYPIGVAQTAIAEGDHVHVHNLKTGLDGTPVYRYEEGPRPLPGSPGPDVPMVRAYRRPDGRVAIRNEVWVVPTVGCVNLTAQKLAQWADAAFGPQGEGLVDGVHAWTHPYGCSQMGDDHATTRTILADLVAHPHAGAVLVVGLGCENNTVDEFKKVLGDYDPRRVRFLVTQKVADEVEEGRSLLRACVEHARGARRESVPLSDLVVGMKCGASDGFSGITANALAGQVTDFLTAGGGTVLLTEVPEMFGAETMLMDRCVSREVFDDTVTLIEGFKDYYRRHGQVVYENPSPGNKEGGISTLEDKSCGCVQKGGQATVMGVLSYGERRQPDQRGLLLLEGPGNDIVSTTAMTAAGANLILFTTGRGTPLGAPVPTVKISSNSALAQNKAAWIDFDAAPVLDEVSWGSTRDALVALMVALASGERLARNEVNGYREIAIFKDGVTL